MENESIASLYEEITKNGKQSLAEFEQATVNAPKMNEELLFSLLKDNEKTAFGINHSFESIRTYEDYKRNVPVTSYDDYADYIERMIHSNETNLVTAYPVNHYLETSGTQGIAKYLPFSYRSKNIVDNITPHVLSRVSNILGKEWTNHRVLMLIIPAKSMLTEQAERSSLSTQLFLEMMGNNISQMVVSPMVCYEHASEVDSRYLNARYALMDRNMSAIMSPFMSFVLDFFRYTENNIDLLIKDIENGTIDESIQMPTPIRQMLLKDIKPDRKRAKELRKCIQDGFQGFAKRCWPNLAFVISTGGGGFKECTLKTYEYVGDTRIMILGYGASECVFSMPVEFDSYDSVLIPNIGFFEFLPYGETDYSKALMLSQVEVGKEYEVIVTNLSGLYRYKMRDAVMITGMYNNCPKVQFSHRIDQTINMFGEKTSELLLRKIANETALEENLTIVDFSVYPDASSVQMKYVFFIEFADDDLKIDVAKMQRTLDEKLRSANFLYDFFSKSGKLAPLELHVLLKESYVYYQRELLAKGKNVSQLKPVRIINDENKKNFFFNRIDNAFELSY
jgi:hypothetical protein